MNLEEKLFEDIEGIVNDFYCDDLKKSRAIAENKLLKYILSICQEAVDEANKAHREELLLLTDKYNAMRIKEIDEACREQKRICANLYAVETKDDQYYSILNAPTPKGDINEKAKH